MQPPFTAAQFFGVFAACNNAVWFAQWLLQDWRAAHLWFCGPAGFGSSWRHDLTAQGLAAGAFTKHCSVCGFTLR